jgi:hypothetical protein
MSAASNYKTSVVETSPGNANNDFVYHILVDNKARILLCDKT